MVQFFVRQYKHKHLHLKINQKFVSIEERVLFSFVKGLINNPLSLFFKKVLDWKVYTRDFQYRLKFCDKCSHSIMSYKFLLLFCEVVNKYRSHINCHMSSKKVCLKNYFICRWWKIEKICCVINYSCRTQIIVLRSFISFNLKFQSKFPDSIKHDIASWSPAHGIRLECTCTVILNALGYIGFKVCLRSDYMSSQTYNTVTL